MARAAGSVAAAPVQASVSVAAVEALMPSSKQKF